MKKFRLNQSGVLHHAAVLGAFIVLFGAIGVFLVISGKAATPAVAGSPLCDTKGNCLSDVGKTGSGHPVVLKKRNAGANQNVVKEYANICSGGHKVTTGKHGCPYPPSTDLNSAYFSGRTIYYLKFAATKNTCAVYSYGAVYTGSCSGDNAAWIGWSNDSLASVGYGGVGATKNTPAEAGFLDASGVGKQLQVKSYSLSELGGVAPTSW